MKITNILYVSLCLNSKFFMTEYSYLWHYIKQTNKKILRYLKLQRRVSDSQIREEFCEYCGWVHKNEKILRFAVEGGTSESEI